MVAFPFACEVASNSALSRSGSSLRTEREMKKSFRDLIAFQLAIELAMPVYDLTADFPSDEKFGLSSQLRRASVGVYAQIAEGNGRFSYGEWRQF
jgi:hypothetical protein